MGTPAPGTQRMPWRYSLPYEMNRGNPGRSGNKKQEGVTLEGKGTDKSDSHSPS